MIDLSDVLPTIPSPNPSHAEEIRERLDQLAKPPGSLGRLEDLVVRFGKAIGTSDLPEVRSRIVTFTEENVSAYPDHVTTAMVETMNEGSAAVNVLAQAFRADHRVVVPDGNDEEGHKEIEEDSREVPETGNIRREPAMNPSRLKDCLKDGMKQADQAKRAAINLLGLGDMGIGNTTSAAAVLCQLLDRNPEEIVGRGTGVNEKKLHHKREVVAEALARHTGQEPGPPKVLARLGGFEIVAGTGLIIGAASRRIPVVLDGFISAASAAAAIKLNSAVRPFLIWGHCSQERGHKVVLEDLEADPLLDLDLRLGEGTGAAVAIGLVDAAVRVYRNMATLEDILE